MLAEHLVRYQSVPNALLAQFVGLRCVDVNVACFTVRNNVECVSYTVGNGCIFVLALRPTVHKLLHDMDA